MLFLLCHCDVGGGRAAAKVVDAGFHLAEVGEPLLILRQGADAS